MILNQEKCHYMCPGKDSVSDLLRFCGEELEASELETVLGVQIDNKLNFENHINPDLGGLFRGPFDLGEVGEGCGGGGKITPV